MNLILFIIMLVFSIAVIWNFYREMRRDAESTLRKKASASESISRGAAVLMLFVGFADISGIIDLGSYRRSGFFFGIICWAAMLLCELNKRKKIKALVNMAKLMLIAAVLEGTIFNIPVYRFCLGSYNEYSFKAEDFAASRGVNYRPEDHDIKIYDGAGAEFTLDGIDDNVGNVYVDLLLENGTESALIQIDAMDETTTTSYRQNVAETFTAKKRAGSQYIDLRLSGKVSSLKIRVEPENGGVAYVRAIHVNSQPPFEASWVRFLLIVLVGSLIWAVVNEKYMLRGFEEKRRLCHKFAVIITAAACIAAVSVTLYKLGDKKLADEMKQTSGDQMTQELVEAFENGSTHILKEVSPDILAIEDPYDSHLRDQLNPSYLWDHVFFDGKYYSYYGIAPVVLVFMPYHMITGYFFPDSIAVMLFAIIGIIGLSFVFWRFTDKFFPRLPAGLFIVSLIILQTVSGIWFSIGRPMFYEVAMSAGFAAMTWAVYFFISANIISCGKISFPRTAIASLLFAVAVLSRPTLVLYCICAAVFMIIAVPRAAGRTAGKKTPVNGGKAVKYLCCAILPMACLGLVQMWYNYDRFGNPFEFGIQYSLTINDFTRTQFQWQLSLVPIYNYFFNPPIFTPVYPFVHTEFNFMNVNGFFYQDYYSTGNTSGLFFIALPMFAYFFFGKAMKFIPDKKQRTARFLTVGIPCVAVPFIIVASVWESGYAVRYMADFAWQSLLGAFAVIFFLHRKLKNDSWRRVITAFMCFSLVWTLYVGGIQNINQALRYETMHLEHPQIAYDLQSIFAFWK